MNDHTPAPPRPRLLRVAAALAGVFAAYTAFGFLGAPPLLRAQIVKRAAVALHRDVAIAKVRVNPLALSVAIEGLQVKGRAGEPFVGWDALYIRVAPLRLLGGELALSEIRLAGLSAHVGLDAAGALSFQDLLGADEKTAPAAAPAAPPKNEGGLALAVGKLAVEDARVWFHDATRKPAFETVAGPLTIRLESFRTKGGGDSPYSFTGTTEAGETFRWTGTVRTEPLRSAGTLTFERIQLAKYAPYLRDAAPVDLQDGLLDVATRYDLEWGGARRTLRLSEGKVTVDRLAVAPRGVADAPVKLRRIEVTGIDVDALAAEAKVALVAVKGGTIRARREPDGRLELARMAPPPAPKPSPWRWSVGALALTDLAVDLEDRAAPRPFALALSDLALRIEGLRPGPEASCPVALSLLWNGRGRLAVKGRVQPFASKGALELDAADLELTPFAPYLEPELAARLTGGRAGAKAQVAFDASGAAPRWTFAGDVRLDALSVAEAGNEDLLRWRALEVSGIDLASTPPRAAVRLVRLVEPRVKAYAWEDGTTSASRARRAPPAVRPAVAARPPAPAPAPGPPWRVAIGAVEVVRGRATFVDRSVAPAAVLNLSRADARVTRLSSDPHVRSDVDVRLEMEGASPVRVSGTLNPLQNDAYTELVVASQGVDLSPLGPYAGKYLGYGIQKGKLDLDLRYKIVNRALAATNVVTVNQFTLGDESHSPDATHIPVRLALALLQDRNGVILLDVPIEGKLDDPDFHLGKVIWRAVLNVLVKVATSPFAALSSLIGGGARADLSLVEFTPGTADPLPAAKERFSLLARSLAERPALALELEASADAAQDGPALRRAALERSLRLMKVATLRPPPASIDDVTLTAEERLRLLRAAHAALPPPAAPPGAPPPREPTPQELEERLLAAAEVPSDAYRSLAAERAQRAREALIAAGLDQGRLFLSEGGERATKEKGARVYFTVR